MQIIFNTPEEAEVFRTELFNLQTILAKPVIKPQEASVLFIEQLYYLASDPLSDTKKPLTES